MGHRRDSILLDPRTSDPGSPVDGELWHRSDLDQVRVRLNGVTVVASDGPKRDEKSIGIENPTTSEDAPFFRCNRAITITEMVISIVGASTPAITVDIRHHTDRNNAGNALITSPTSSSEAANNAESTGHVITSFDDATIPANSFIWVEVDAVTGLAGAGEHVAATLFYTED